jgi:hypothetical protein
MITACLDWNCIITLEIIAPEEERKYALAIQQIREWYKQRKIALCIAGPSRLENHSAKNRGVYNEQEWTEKLRNVGLDGIELRPAGPRFRSYPGLDLILIREIHNRVFPDVPFSLQDYAALKKVELPEPRVFYSFPQSLQEEFEQETPEQRKLRRKWNNRKNDALSLHAFATWATSEDVFVSADTGDVIKKRELLKAPYQVRVKEPADVVVHGEPMRILREKLIEIPGHIVILGHIMDPFEAEKYLRDRLEDHSDK